jgi:hypothetical protein
VAGVAGGLFGASVGGCYWSSSAARCQSGAAAAGAAAATGRWTWPVVDGGWGCWGSGASSSSTKVSTLVEIVSYNILSDSLCRPEQFTHCSADDLDDALRLARIKAKLVAQMERGKVICLQEVSRAWAGELAPLLEAHGYSFMDGLSGSAFSGYMGQCLAWPTKHFVAERV